MCVSGRLFLNFPRLAALWLIAEAWHAAAVAVNVGQTMLYWRLAKRIREDVLNHKRAGYEDANLETLIRHRKPV